MKTITRWLGTPFIHLLGMPFIPPFYKMLFILSFVWTSLTPIVAAIVDFSKHESFIHLLYRRFVCLHSSRPSINLSVPLSVRSFTRLHFCSFAPSLPLKKVSSEQAHASRSQLHAKRFRFADAFSPSQRKKVKMQMRNNYSHLVPESLNFCLNNAIYSLSPTLAGKWKVTSHWSKTQRSTLIGSRLLALLILDKGLRQRNERNERKGCIS